MDSYELGDGRTVTLDATYRDGLLGKSVEQVFLTVEGCGSSHRYVFDIEGGLFGLGRRYELTRESLRESACEEEARRYVTDHLAGFGAGFSDGRAVMYGLSAEGEAGGKPYSMDLATNPRVRLSEWSARVEFSPHLRQSADNPVYKEGDHWADVLAQISKADRLELSTGVWAVDDGAFKVSSRIVPYQSFSFEGRGCGKGSYTLARDYAYQREKEFRGAKRTTLNDVIARERLFELGLDEKVKEL